ncbi:MAG: hydroxymethylglutaryl-CoA lyase [Trebonia sp.]|jgi:hydroxymethylglutaryl-CoA lyase
MNVEIVEVSPRDGLQNEHRVLPTETKLELVRRSVAAGLRRVEAASFARPDRVPQLADAEAVMAAVARDPAVRYSGLVLNRRGLERALSCGVDEVTYVVLATETFSQRNQGMSVNESVAAWLDIAAAAEAAGCPASVTISAAFGCPFEGDVSPAQVGELAAAVLAGRPRELILADTIGVGVPGQVRDLVGRCRELDPDIVLRAHFHDTRRTAIANALAAVEAGMVVLDASIGGVGGCPFAPNAGGNVATEDLVYALHRSGYQTGIDFAGVAETGVWLAGQLGLPQVASALGRAGWAPASGELGR